MANGAATPLFKKANPDLCLHYPIIFIRSLLYSYAHRRKKFCRRIVEYARAGADIGGEFGGGGVERMALIDQTLFGTVDKVQIAIARLREFEPPEGYYVAFSGGKDSVVTLDLCKRAGVKYDAHYNLTTVDPPELVRFIKSEYPDVKRHRPEKTMWQLIVENGTPPTRLMRYCCAVLKEGGGVGRIVVTGVRKAESYARSKWGMVENCLKRNKRYLHPIIDWTDEDVWGYIRRYSVPYCSLYDEGFKRLGCILCPMGDKNGMTRDVTRWPKYKDTYLRTFARMLTERERKGLPMPWKTPEQVMHWWIYNPPKGDPDQGVLFE
jgi:phosphoadenosine phosphosulfate reductase